jgi:hypothetical protein
VLAAPCQARGLRRRAQRVAASSIDPMRTKRTSTSCGSRGPHWPARCPGSWHVTLSALRSPVARQQALSTSLLSSICSRQDSTRQCPRLLGCVWIRMGYGCTNWDFVGEAYPLIQSDALQLIERPMARVSFFYKHGIPAEGRQAVEARAIRGSRDAPAIASTAWACLTGQLPGAVELKLSACWGSSTQQQHAFNGFPILAMDPSFDSNGSRHFTPGISSTMGLCLQVSSHRWRIPRPLAWRRTTLACDRSVSTVGRRNHAHWHQSWSSRGH